LAPLGIVFSLFLIIGWPWVTDGHFHMIGGLDIVTMWRFVIWMAIGLVIYFSYGMHNSKLATAGKP
ncbi:MAG: amino acid permease, partial [Rhodanobacter sp.]